MGRKKISAGSDSELGSPAKNDQKGAGSPGIERYFDKVGGNYWISIESNDGRYMWRPGLVRKGDLWWLWPPDISYPDPKEYPVLTLSYQELKTGMLACLLLYG